MRKLPKNKKHLGPPLVRNSSCYLCFPIFRWMASCFKPIKKHLQTQKLVSTYCENSLRHLLILAFRNYVHKVETLNYYAVRDWIGSYQTSHVGHILNLAFDKVYLGGLNLETLNLLIYLQQTCLQLMCLLSCAEDRIVRITSALSYHNFSQLQTKRESWRQKTKHNQTTQLDTTFCLPQNTI